MKIRSVGAVLFHVDERIDGRTERDRKKGRQTDRQTDKTKPIVAFRSFCKHT